MNITFQNQWSDVVFYVYTIINEVTHSQLGGFKLVLFLYFTLVYSERKTAFTSFWYLFCIHIKQIEHGQISN